MMKSCRLLHITFPSSEQRVEPARSRELIDRAMDVPIMKTNLVEERNAECENIKTWSHSKISYSSFKFEHWLFTSKLKALVREHGNL